MSTLKKHHSVISTVLAFALIPLSGFATDIYLPSFPTMAKLFGTSQADIQLSLVVFVVSGGIGQLFVGSLVDSFGRYKLNLLALMVFAASSFVVANSHSIGVLLAMRVIQGLTVALIVVSKRAFLIDLYSGEKLKHYTSLLTIIWATAPIAAPFIGGFLHEYFGWQSNFYFLGAVTLVLIALELIYSGETIKVYHPFDLPTLLKVYSAKLGTPDFVISIVILGLAFSMVMMYNMASPFIIEQVFDGSAVTTGNCSLLSGLALLTGGLLSKSMINKPLIEKVKIVGPLLLGLPVVLIATANYFSSLYLMMAIVLPLHLLGGFTFNSFYAYALGRFTTHAGITSGLTGAGNYIIVSLLTFLLANVLHVEDLAKLGIGYLILATLLVLSFIFFEWTRRTAVLNQPMKSIESPAVAAVK